MAIPVFLFTGFLESGKTTFIQDTLEDKRFNSGERTLLLVFEEGENEYDESKFSGKNVKICYIDDNAELNEKNLKKLADSIRAERVLVEYNGMWQIQDFYDNMPEDRKGFFSKRYLMTLVLNLTVSEKKGNVMPFQ